MVSLTSSGQLASCAATAGLVAVFWALSLAQVQAQTQTVIRGEFVEVHDFLSDDNDPSAPRTANVEWSHAFRITLSGKNQVTEKWDSERLKVGSANSPLSSQGENEGIIGDNGTIGQNSNHVVWHILGKNKLQRIFQGQRYLMIMDIAVSADKTCIVEVRYLRQTGFVSIVMKRANTGTMGNFSLPRVERASCTIEATPTQ
jgi:hypothetical protein